MSEKSRPTMEGGLPVSLYEHRLGMELLGPNSSVMLAIGAPGRRELQNIASYMKVGTTPNSFDFHRMGYGGAVIFPYSKQFYIDWRKLTDALHNRLNMVAMREIHI